MLAEKITVRKRLSREEPQDGKRGRILEAALELFETRGFDGVAVPEIALKAGVATGTIYRYFDTKEALVNALYRYWKRQYNEVVLAPPYDGATPRQTFAHYWQRMALFARTFPRAIRFMDLHHHASYLDEESRAIGRNYASAAEIFVREARRNGAIRNLDPIMVVALMWGACAGLVKFSAQGALAFDAETAADMEEALWRAIANT